jgi:hypothetical protein
MDAVVQLILCLSHNEHAMIFEVWTFTKKLAILAVYIEITFSQTYLFYYMIVNVAFLF